MGTRIDKVKQHLKDNRNVYIALGAGMLIGGTVVYFVALRNVSQSVTTLQGIAYKSPVTNNVIQQALPRAGHAGKVFMDQETGEIFMSARKLADSLKVSPQAVRRYLSGDLDALAGRQFNLIADGAPSLTASHALAV